MIEQLKRWRRSMVRREADRSILALNHSLAHLGLPQAPSRVRAMLRIRSRIRHTVDLISLISIWLMIWSFTYAWGIFADIKWTTEGVEFPDYPSEIIPLSQWRQWPGDFQTALFVIFGIFALAYAMTVVAIVLFAPLFLSLGLFLGRPWSPLPITLIARRIMPISILSGAINSAARAKRAPWRLRPKALRKMARTLRSTETALLQLHRSSGTLTIRSHRRRALKLHARLVVSALRQAEQKIDAQGDAALPELAAMLSKIADRIASGRIGALLDESQIANLKPALDREPLRLAVAALLIAATAFGVSMFSLPEGADTYAIGGISVVILALLYGPRVHQFLSVISSIRGA